MKITKLKTLTVLCCLLATTFVCSAQTFDENGFNTNPSATDNQYQEPNVINSVYQIANAGNLYWFAAFVNQGGANASANAILTDDIVVNTEVLVDGELNTTKTFREWTPIGISYDNPYQGIFDGNGHTIRGLYFNDGTKDYVGLFGYIGSGATVQNVGVVDSYFKGYQYVGGVVGFSHDGTISNVYNTGAVSGETFVGGVVGYNDGGTVSNVYNTGSVSGSGDNVGGVVGANYGTVSNAYNTGSVNGSGDDVGGVVGYSFNGTVSNVYNTGSVRGTGIHVGGVVGNNYGTVSNVYNTGVVSGDSGVGGVVGQNDGTVSNGFFNTAYYSGNAIGVGSGTANTVVGKTSTELANLTVGNGGDFPLLEGETESPWAKDISYDKATGKLTSTLPYLKNLPVVPDAETILSFTVASGVIQISTAEDLNNFAKLVNEYHITDVDAELTTNLTVNSNLLGENNANVDAETGEYTRNAPANVWTPIGTSSDKYNGTFDGKGNTVSGLYFNDGTKDYVGLFGYIGSGATVQNVGVIDSYIRGYNCVGGVVGDNDGGAIINVYNAGSVSAASGSVGGVVGINLGSISNVYNTGSVSGSSYVGGVAGSSVNGTVSNVYNTGSVRGAGGGVGGVVGINNWGSISKACNTGSVSGDQTRVGGVVGTNRGTIGNVYNTGSVSGSRYVGGVVGENNNGTVSNVYNTGSVSGTYDVGGVVGGNNGGDINNAYYDNQTCNNCNSYGTGKTLAELANLTVGNGGDFPLLEGETESPWANGIYYDKATGKLANIKLPYLKSLKILPKPQDVEMEFNVKDNVIQISTAEDLKNFAKLVNEYDIRDVDAELTTNLTVNSNLLGENNANVDAETGEYTGNTPANVWTPIGTSSAKYNGTFDGNGYTIRGLYFNDESTEYVGLFGYIDESAKVQNVGVVDSYFKGYQYVGGVVGYNDGGTVSNAYNTGFVSIAVLNILAGGKVTVNNGATLIVTGTLTNSDAANLVIEDGGQLICNNVVAATVKKNIIAHDETSGWYTIASPVNGSIYAPTAMTSNAYDLYYYDESAYTWRNYKANSFKLANGNGYLYANGTATVIEFAGTLRAGNEEVVVDLSYESTYQALKGFNLVGNPFAHNIIMGTNATMTNENTGYYVVENGSNLVAKNSATEIKPCQGFMVQATGEGQKITFNPGAKETQTKHEYITIAAGNGDFMDMAYICTNADEKLGKIALDNPTAKVYLQQNGNDYAIAPLGEATSMVVCFKAPQSGTYTINVSSDVEGVSLKDMKTGYVTAINHSASYTFEASENDAESRFKILFGTTVEENEAQMFVMQSGSDLIISGEGCVQIIDMMGRVLRTVQVESNVTVSTEGMTAGTYVVRMLTANGVQTQKVIVK